MILGLKVRKKVLEKECFISFFLRSILRCVDGEIKIEVVLCIFERLKRIIDIFVGKN